MKHYGFEIDYLKCSSVDLGDLKGHVTTTTNTLKNVYAYDNYARNRAIDLVKRALKIAEPKELIRIQKE